MPERTKTCDSRCVSRNRTVSELESIMLRRMNVVWLIVLVIGVLAVLVASWATLGTAAAQKQAVTKPQDKLALGEPEVVQLLLLIDTDKNGKISKEEWMKFMEAEFDRLDKSKDGSWTSRN
jgi:hypothetical protein